MFYIRADGNAKVGMGHIMRCLSIAEAALELGSRPVFISADNDGRIIINERGFECTVLDTDYTDMESELGKLARILNREDIILVDSYCVTGSYLRSLGEMCKTAYLEDMGKPYPVNLLINYNIYALALAADYQKPPKPDKVLLGAEYMPLRDIYRYGIDYEVRGKVSDVMITTGGSDPHFAAGAILDEIFKNQQLSDGITYHMVSGPFNSFADRLKEKCGGYKNVILYEGLSSLKDLMKKCDTVITATGSTIYEACAVGVPMVCFYFAENQRQGAQALSQLTEIKNAGCISEDRAATAKNIAYALLRCVSDFSYRQRLYIQEKKLIDGQGSIRLAQNILAL